MHLYSFLGHKVYENSINATNIGYNQISINADAPEIAPGLYLARIVCTSLSGEKDYTTVKLAIF